MLPTFEQTAVAAYFLWRRLGGGHGRDRRDWLAAEQDLLFALNYEVVWHDRLDARPARGVHGRIPRVCRFCEQAGPVATFDDGSDVCEECRAEFREGIDREWEAWLGAARAGRRSATAEMPVAAFKGLVKAGLTLVPRSDLHFLEDAIEWVVNPDHDFDARLFQGFGCRPHRLPAPAPHPWEALARRLDDDAPFPSLLYFRGAGDLVIQASLPLDARDDDREDEGVIVPRTCAPFFENPGNCWFVPVARGEARPSGRSLLRSVLN